MQVIPIHQSPRQKINVLIVTPQSLPFVGAGGLAPFIREFVEAARTVPLAPPKLAPRVIIPLYDGVGRYTGFDTERTGIEDFEPVVLSGATTPLTLVTDVQDQNGNPYQVTVEQASVQTDGGPILYYALRGEPDLFSRPIFPRVPESAGASAAEIDAARKSAIKFAVFSNAVVKLLISPEGRQLLGDWFPHVIHCHDWPTGIIPAYLARLYDAPKYWEPYRKPRTLFTYHSCPPGDGAQGVFTQGNSEWVAESLLRACGWEQGANEPVYAGNPNLHHECDSTVWRSHNPDWSRLNCAVSFLKAGLAFSDEANTVSPGCAVEMQDPPHSLGNEDLITARSSQNEWQGIRNGINWAIYDAEIDDSIIAPYTARNWENVKKRNKVELITHSEKGLDSRLQQLSMGNQGRTAPLKIGGYQLSLPDFNPNQDFILNFRSFHVDEGSFLAVLPARLEWQKGVDIVLAGMDPLFKALDNLHFILMGRGSETRNCASPIQRLASNFPDRFLLINWFDPEEGPIWERLLIAAADVFLMPSRTEPCGINQQRALHYGAVVIGSEVGGLRNVPENTVIKLDTITGTSLLPDNANAILFPLQYPANPETLQFTHAVKGFKEAMTRAYEIWKNNPEAWEKLVENAMTYQNSWDYPVTKYREKYVRLAR